MNNINENLNTLKQRFNPGMGAKIVEALQSAGYETVFVGGCVRDSILGIEPHDYDITTAATPRDMKRALDFIPEVRELILVSAVHGTVVVVMEDGSKFEVTPFRSGRVFRDGQSYWLEPEQTSLLEDLKHRDFTVNAIALRWPECEILDPYGGIEDLNAKVLSCTGNPEDRFLEDSVRIIRAVRLYCQLDFICIEDSTEKAMSKLAYLLERAPVERTFAELCKVLVTQYPNGVLAFPEVAYALIPELKDMDGFKQHNPYHRFTVMGHTSAALDALPRVVVRMPPHVDFDRLTVALALLLHDIGKPHKYSVEEVDGEIRYHFIKHELVSADLADGILYRLKAPTQLRESVVELIRYHSICTKMGDRGIKSLCSKLGIQQTRHLLYHSLCDTMGRGQYTLHHEEDVAEAIEIIRLFEEIICRPQPFNVRDLAISGKDLIELGISPGPIFGEILSDLRDLVLEGKLLNKKEALIEAAKDMLDFKDTGLRETNGSFSKTYEI